MADSTLDGTLHLTRSIPVPRTISPAAQALMAMGNEAVPGRLAAPESFPALDDREGWKVRIAQMDQQIVSGVEANANAVDATVDDRQIDGVHVYVITPAGADTSEDAPILYDIHGGGLVAGGGEACRLMGLTAAARSGLQTWAVDYRMPPDHPYPAPLDDCLTGYRALLESKPPPRIVVGGGSAGGNLAAALMLKARAESVAMPACLLLMTPEVDLTESGDSFETNKGLDFVLVDRLSEEIALYADGHDLDDPLLSPLFGDVSGFPPTYLQAGTRDLFLSNTVRFHRKLRAADVEAELHIGEAMPHGGFFGFAPEDAELDLESRKFVAKHL
jgi:epsilon-lactone hydrolase